MSRIYHQASKVVVWLGSEYSGSDVMMGAIRSLRVSATGDPQSSRALRSTHHGAWHRLIELDYWQRLWILQEIMLARSVTVLLGMQAVTWDQLNMACIRYADVDEKTANSRLMSIRAYRQLGTTSNLSWVEVMGLSKESLCRDEHDRIFALLGLVDPTLRVRPDYERPIGEIYEQVINLERAYRRQHATASERIFRFRSRALGCGSFEQFRKVLEDDLKQHLKSHDKTSFKRKLKKFAQECRLGLNRMIMLVEIGGRYQLVSRPLNTYLNSRFALEDATRSSR